MSSKQGEKLLIRDWEKEFDDRFKLIYPSGVEHLNFSHEDIKSFIRQQIKDIVSIADEKQIYFSKLDDPKSWNLENCIECKTNEDAKKLEKLFNSMVKEIETLRKELLDAKM